MELNAVENKTLKTIITVFLSMVGFGVGLAAVSMFLSVVDVKTIVPTVGTTSGTMSASLSLFDADWDSMDASPMFMILSFMVLVVGLAIMAIDASMRQKQKKKTKGLNYAAFAISVVGFVMLIVSAIVTKNDVEESMNKIALAAAKAEAGIADDSNDQQLLLMIKMMVSYKLGYGAIMGLVGGAIGLVGGAMLLVPAFDPAKTAAAPETAPVTPAAQPAAEAPVQPASEEAAAVADDSVTAAENNNNDTVA